FDKDAAKRDVTQISCVTLASCDLENLLEVQRLRCTDDIPNRIGFQFLHAIIDCSEIRRCIIESAVAFANDARFIGQLGIIPEENYHRTFTDFCDSRLEQALDYTGLAIVVKT